MVRIIKNTLYTVKSGPSILSKHGSSWVAGLGRAETRGAATGFGGAGCSAAWTTYSRNPDALKAGKKCLKVSYTPYIVSKSVLYTL